MGVVKKSVIDKIDASSDSASSLDPLDDLNSLPADESKSDIQAKVKTRKKKAKNTSSTAEERTMCSLARNSLELPKPVSRKKQRRKKKLSDITEKSCDDEDEDEYNDFLLQNGHA